MAESAVGSTWLTSATLHLHVQAATNYIPITDLGIITLAGTNLPTSKGWIAWLAKAESTHITFAQDYYTIESKDIGRIWTQLYRVQDQLSANEPTAPAL